MDGITAFLSRLFRSWRKRRRPWSLAGYKSIALHIYTTTRSTGK